MCFCHNCRMYLLTCYVRVRPPANFSVPGRKIMRGSRVPGACNLYRTGPVILHTWHAISVVGWESAMRLVRQGGAGFMVFPARPVTAGGSQGCSSRSNVRHFLHWPLISAVFRNRTYEPVGSRAVCSGRECHPSLKSRRMALKCNSCQFEEVSGHQIQSRQVPQILKMR
jgi:hypothetical protein